MAKVFMPTTEQQTKGSTFKRLALGSVALAATALATLGLYGHHADHFHHDSARLLRELASASGIEVTLVPRNGASAGLEVHGILLPKQGVNGQLAFDGRLSYELVGSQYNFTLIDERGYITVQDLSTGLVTRKDCIHPDNIPPIATLTAALQNARVIDAVGANAVSSCASGKLVEFDFAGEPYVLCTGSQSDASTEDAPGTVSVQGDDLQATLTLLSASSERVPTLASLTPPTGFKLETCELIDSKSGDASLLPAVSTTTRVLQRTQDALQVATGGRRLGRMGSTDCGCTGGKKQCLFVHGFGYPDTGAATDSFEYFGTIEKQLPCCSSVKFVHLDTNDQTWYSDQLTGKVCDTAVAMTNGSDPMQLQNIAIIAHSMGNLITAAAIMNNKCALASNSKWISLAGPIFGTMTATTITKALDLLPTETLKKFCTNDPNTVLDDPIFSLLESNSLCSTLISLRSIAFKGSSQSTPAQDALFVKAGEIFKKNVGANICGVSSTGLASSDSVKKALEGLISNHASSANDGQVHFDSCHATIDASKYSTKWNGGAFYKASVNHLDAAMRHGDGWWGDDRKPVKWLNCQF